MQPYHLFKRIKFFLLFVVIVGVVGCNQATEPTMALATEPPPAPTEAAAEPTAEPSEASAEAAEGAAASGREPVPAEILAQLSPRPRGLAYGYVNLAGEWVIEPQFQDALEFSEGLAAIRVDGLYGYIDSTGQMVIEPQFNAAQSFSEGLASILKDQQWGYIDPAGEIVIEPQFDYADRFSEGLAYIVLDERIGFIDQTGQTVIEPQSFDFVQPFSEGLAVFGFEGLAGYIDPTGQFVIQPQFTFANDFSEGLAVVELDDQLGFIDPTGAFVIEPQFDFARSFSEGLAVVAVDGQVGYINQAGEMVVEPQFTVGFDFSEGLAAVLVDDLWGYIDPTGEIVIEPQFALAGNFEDGLADVIFDENRPAYIDRSGQVVIEVTPAERVIVETTIDLTPEQVSFDVDPSLAGEITSEKMLGETTLHPDIPYFALVPEHLKFTFADPEVLQLASYEQSSVAGTEPKLLIYPAADFEKVSPLASEQIQALKDLLAEQPEAIPFEIPTLPLVDAAQFFHAQVEYLDFQGGRGLRFITQYVQEPRPVANAEIFYTFQGLTDDGQYYIAFFYPVSTVILPNTIEDSSIAEDYETFVQNLNSYMPETIQRLDALATIDYTPDLALLDAVVESLTIEPAGDGAAMTAEDQASTAAAGAAPVGTWTVSTYRFGGVSAWGEAESETLLDKVADISTESITFDGASCEGITFASDTAAADDYFDVNFRILPGTIGITQSELEIITSDCDLPGFGEFMKLDNGQLMLNIEGVFFFLDQ